MLRAPLLAVVFSVASSPLLLAQQGDVPPVDAASLLKTLEVLETKQSANSQSQYARTLQSLTQAGASASAAMKLYEDATKATRFLGLTMEQTQFQDWKKKEGEKLKSDAMQTAVRLHVQYLLLTVQNANGTTMEALGPALANYAAELAKALETVKELDKEELLKKSVGDGVIAKWYGFGKRLGGVKTWEMSAGNIDGIYAKTLLPWMREKKDPRMIAYWDARIARDARLVDPKAQEKKPTQFEIDQFNFIAKPTLLWSRAQDLAALGQRNRAINEMFAIVKAYPDHPDNAEWLKQLRDLLSAPAAG